MPAGEQSDPHPDGDPHDNLYALVGQALTVEHIRQYVRYESPQFSNFNRLARRLDYDLLALISAISSLHIYIANRGGQVDAEPLAEFEESAARLVDSPRNPDVARQALDRAYARAIPEEMQRLRDLFGSRRPALAEIVAARRATHDLAERMLAYAVTLEAVAERRAAIRGAVSAELVASALADYAQAFDTGEHERADSVSGSSASRLS